VYRHASAYGGDPARLVVAGHSAGGHLAALLLCCDWRSVGADLPPQVVRSALAVSGVFDLEPLRHAPFLAPDLRLDAASARRLSPAFMPPPRAAALHAVVGANESAEFGRQTRLIAKAWGPAGVPTCETIPDRHHMNVLHDLADPSRRLHRLALGLLGLPAPAAPPRRSGSSNGAPHEER
jgi:arylformamidase